MIPTTRREQLEAQAAGGSEVNFVPTKREEQLLDRIRGGSGPGGEVTPASIVTATGQMTSQQAEATLSNLGGEPKKLTVTVTENSGSYTADKTFAQMWAAYHTGKKTVSVAMGESEFALYEADPSGMAFVSVSIANGAATVRRLTVDDNDTWAFAEFAAEQKPTTVTVSGTTPTITPTDNHIYNCGELTSLTISNPPATGAYSIVFTSGSTATTTTIPATILGLEDFAAEANTLYEINVLDNRAVVGSWAVSA